MYNISINTFLLALTATAAFIAIIFYIKDPSKRVLTVVVFIIAWISMYYALKEDIVKPPLPEPPPTFKIENIIDIKGIYKGHFINVLGEKELLSLQVEKHTGRDSIKLVFIDKKKMSTHYAKYFFSEQLIVIKNGDSAVVTKDSSFVFIKSFNKIHDSWEFEKPL